MNRVGLLVFTLLALCLGTSTAHAGIDWMPKFETSAISYWGHGALPGCGKPVYQWVDHSLLTKVHGFDVDADADAATCVIRFDSTEWHNLSVPEICLVDMHEIGHLYGHQHNEGGVMSNADDFPRWQVFKPCSSLIASVKFWVRTPAAKGEDPSTYGAEQHTSYRPRVTA